MDKKWILGICIIILLAIGLIAFYSFSNQETELKIGNTKFQLPNGYHVGNSEKDNVINLTNGTNEIYIEKYDGNITDHINSYVKYTEKKNYTVKNSNFTVGKTLVYKSNVNNSSVVHYWFVKNKNIYNIYSWDKNPEMDSITIKLIESCS